MAYFEKPYNSVAVQRGVTGAFSSETVAWSGEEPSRGGMNRSAQGRAPGPQVTSCITLTPFNVFSRVAPE